MVQMIATSGYSSLAEARQDIRHSIELETYQPNHTSEMTEAINKYKKLTNQLSKETV